MGIGRGRVIVVRHGETEWSRSGRHTGRTDVPLEPAGAEQAVAVGRCLAGTALALVLSSPLARASDTCRLAGFGEQAELTDDLRLHRYFLSLLPWCQQLPDSPDES
jgi:probable phosphoglycerate mutase